MPAQLWLEDGVLCPYMSFHELDRVPSNTLESVISAAPVPASWTRHSSVVSSHNDNTWFPSALSYGKSCFFCICSIFINSSPYILFPRIKLMKIDIILHCEFSMQMYI